MSTCWYCHWGWSKQVHDIYTTAVAKLGGFSGPLHYGPSHVVWDDENWGCVDWCLEHFNEYRGQWTDEQLEVVRWSLLELQKLPKHVLDPEPDDYDGEHPENYPPPIDVVMEDKR